MTEFEQKIANFAETVKMTRNKYGNYVSMSDDGEVDLEAFAKIVLAHRQELLAAIGAEEVLPFHNDFPQGMSP